MSYQCFSNKSTYFHVLPFFCPFIVFLVDDSTYINCKSMVVKTCLELERKECQGVIAKLIDYKFTMAPATQFVSGSGI
jgi:hypothetical protein